MAREPTQRDLDFMQAERERSRRKLAEQREDEIDRLLAEPIDRLGAKHYAEALGIGLENVDRVYHWKARRGGQRPPAELLLAVCAEDDGAMAAFCELAGYEVPRRALAIPDAELVKRYRAALLQFGERGAELDRQVRAAPPTNGGKT